MLPDSQIANIEQYLLGLVELPVGREHSRVSVVDFDGVRRAAVGTDRPI